MKLARSNALFSVSAFALSMGAAPAWAQAATGQQAAVGTAPAQPVAPASADASVPATQAESVPTTTTSRDDGTANQVEDIVVTAQRREQSLQSVPIAITAITTASLEANRVTSVQDLSGLAPNFTVRPSAGGVALPSFQMRGITSYGVVPGSDKEISIYVDGVYVGSPRGSAFELPDIERIEILRGPQGTLFGRNATAGAVSITTRDPTGVQGAREDVTIGNYGERRIRTTLDLPAVGPFSAYGTYVYDARDGDIRNLGAGTLWDRTGPNTRTAGEVSPATLGSKNSDQYFAALRFEPTNTFNLTYKFDHSSNNFSPSGVTPVGYNTSAPLIGPFLTALFNSQPTPVAFDARAERPDAVNNSFAILSRQRTTGHTLLGSWRLSDHVSIKSISAYRQSFINSAQNIDGLGGLVFTQASLVPYATFVAFARNPALATASAAVQGATIGGYAQALAPLIGSRFCVICNNAQSAGHQYSQELQVNYTSHFLDLTAGALYYHQYDIAGGPQGVAQNFTFTPLSTTGRLALGNESVSRNKVTSIAGYVQGEVHVIPSLDIVGGIRLTHDRKTGTYSNGGTFTPGPNGFVDGTVTGQSVIAFSYEKTKPTYSAGLNFRPAPGVLLYGKYSTAFVSGGSTGGIPYNPETVSSGEIGAKADLFDRHVRTNIALFHADYTDIQSAQSGSNFGRPDLGTVIIDFGNETAQGFEFETTVLPITGVSLGGSLGYTDYSYSNVNPSIVAAVGGTRYRANFIPHWTAGLNGQYEVGVGGDTKLALRGDAIYQSRRINDGNPDRLATTPGFSPYLDSTEPYWIVNARLSLRNVKFGPVNTEIAGWVRNLTQTRAVSYPLQLGAIEVADYVPARTYGVDMFFRF